MVSNHEIANLAVSAYESDFYVWTIEQAKFLQEGKWSCLDVPNLIEEIERWVGSNETS